MSALATVSIFVAVAALALVITPIVRWYVRYRGARLVTCPETKAPAAVEVDAFQVALSEGGAHKLCLKECSRWPERENCGQDCLSQIEASPEDCLVRSIVTKKRNLCGSAGTGCCLTSIRPRRRFPSAGSTIRCELILRTVN
jgi:hypothetical protein